jgi:hypothetical protein
MKLRAVFWLVAAFVINFFAVGSFILGEYYSRLGGIYIIYPPKSVSPESGAG